MMKLQLKGERIKASLSGLLNRRKESASHFAEGESGPTTNYPPEVVVQCEASAEARWNATTDDDAQGAKTTLVARRASVPDLVGSEYEDVYAHKTGGFLNHAQHLVLNNPTMVDNSINIVNQGADDKARKAKKLLSKHMIPGAAHDSSARDPPPKCHPGTRIKINERIVAWFYGETKRELIFWIYGPAGVGKSAIAQTFAETLASAECLGASVFLSRPGERNSSRCVFITIAYELSVHMKAYSAFITEKLAFDPGLVTKSMKEQFKTFIVEPFAQKKIGAGGKVWGILLDGLDELDEREPQQEIIRLITTFVHDHPKIPLAWIVTSRPEPHISNTFKQQRTICNTQEECIPVDSPEACQDVERYLRSSLETTQRVKFPHIVTAGWPEETKIVKLAQAASGLFAFAQVAVRYIEDPNHADPTTRLDDVLSVIDGSKVSSLDDQPFAHLDALYTRILTRIPSKMWPTTQAVLGAIPALGLHSVKALSVVLGFELSRVYASINDFYSVLDIPPLDDVYSRKLRFHHASFDDFLRDATRSKEFFTSPKNANRDLNERGLKIWVDFKRRFSCGPSSGYENRWSAYALQFHFGVNQPADVLARFDVSLSDFVHAALWHSLWERHQAVQQEMSQHNWDELLELLCQIDATTMCHGFDPLTRKCVADFWFDLWKTDWDKLRRKGVVSEIRLEQLQFGHLEWPKEYPTHVRFVQSEKTNMVSFARVIKPSTLDSFGEYISGLKNFQQRQPTLQVLICGTHGHRFAIFECKYTEDDFKKRSLHTAKKSFKADKHDYYGGYCVPYADNV